MRSSVAGGGRLLQTKGDEDGLGHALIERRDGVAGGVVVQRVVKNADHRRVAASEHSRDAAALPAVGPGRRQFHQDLIALHGAVHLVGRNEDVVIPAGLAGLRPHKAEAIAVHIQTAGDQVAASGCLGQRPVIAVGLDQFAARGHAVQLFEQHTAFAAPTQPQFADQLLVAGTLAGGAFNSMEEFAVSHPNSSAGRRMSLLILMGQSTA